MLYRILTEDKNRPAIVDIVRKHFDGFTLIPAIGYWQGQEERSLIIEIDTPTKCAMHIVADEIAYVNKQQAVIMQEIDSTTRISTYEPSVVL